MKDITENFGTLYHPKLALVFYQTKGMNSDTYVESFDMDKNGNPINAHPLTVREANQLAKALKTAKEEKEPCLKSDGIISNAILHIDPIQNKVIWFSKAMQRELSFTENLGIPKGIANIPPMLWIANKNSLSVFALGNNRRPKENTKLYNALFLIFTKMAMFVWERLIFKLKKLLHYKSLQSHGKIIFSTAISVI